MTARKLHISPTLSLPTDAVTSTLVVYGGKGMGKTNLASVLVEEFAAAGSRFAVIDPMGVWWGLRHSADGKGVGIKALILGGIHGDMPIEPTAGAVIADLVVDEDDSVIIDISRRADGSMWSIAERVRFVTDYTKRLYQRQGERRRPIMQVIDEAARFAPQVVRAGDMDVAKCMGAVAVLVEEGRNVGVGVTLVTQRSARLNKDVAELADCMIAFRIVGPNSMRAVLDWLGEHVDKARLKEIGEKLRSLPRGSALVISPGWLELEDIVAMRKRQTFDSSKTPEEGKQQVRVSGAGAKVDLAKYQARMAEVVERAKENDPKALKTKVADQAKRIAELERQLAAKPSGKVQTKTVEKPVIKDAQLARIEKLFEQAKTINGRIEDSGEKLVNLSETIRNAFGEIGKAMQLTHEQPPPVIYTPREMPAKQIAARVARTGVERGNEPRHTDRVNGTRLPEGEALVLRALIQYPNGLRREQLGVLTTYKRSTRDAYIARLREKGYVDTSGDRVVATQGGVDAMPDAEPLPSGDALREFWERKLPSGEREVLAFLCEQYPNAVERTAIDEATTFKRSTRDAYISRLAAKELVVDAGRGAVMASSTLFEVAS